MNIYTAQVIRTKYAANGITTEPLEVDERRASLGILTSGIPFARQRIGPDTILLFFKGKGNSVCLDCMKHCGTTCLLLSWKIFAGVLITMIKDRLLEHTPRRSSVDRIFTLD